MSSLAIPPADGPLTQGSVVDGLPWGIEEPPLGIVLSNICDLVLDKAVFALFGALKDARDVVQRSAEFKGITGAADEQHRLSGTKWKKLTNELEFRVFNNQIGRYFLVDARQALDFDPLIVDFQQLICIPFSQSAALREVARLESPDREKLVMHFGAYLSRIGVERPDELERDRLIEELAAPYQRRLDQPGP